MGHGANDSNIGILLQGEDVLVVLEKNDTLRVELTSKLLVLLGVDIVKDLVVGDTSKGRLEEALGELCAEDTRNGQVEILLVKLSVLDELRDDLVTPVAATHLDIVAIGEGLCQLA